MSKSARIMAGQAGVVIAGGVESVSRVPMFSDRGPLYTDPAVMQQVGTVHMGIAADFIATREGFSREALDAYALRTREKARAEEAREVGEKPEDDHNEDQVDAATAGDDDKEESARALA